MVSQVAWRFKRRPVNLLRYLAEVRIVDQNSIAFPINSLVKQSLSAIETYLLPPKGTSRTLFHKVVRGALHSKTQDDHSNCDVFLKLVNEQYRLLASKSRRDFVICSEWVFTGAWPIRRLDLGASSVWFPIGKERSFLVDQSIKLSLGTLRGYKIRELASQRPRRLLVCSRVKALDEFEAQELGADAAEVARGLTHLLLNFRGSALFWSGKPVPIATNSIKAGHFMTLHDSDLAILANHLWSRDYDTSEPEEANITIPKSFGNKIKMYSELVRADPRRMDS